KPVPGAPEQPPANRREAFWRRAGSPGSRASRRHAHANRSKCCHARFAALLPRSNQPSQMCRTSAMVMMILAGTDAADVMMMPGLRCPGVVLVADELRAVFA